MASRSKLVIFGGGIDGLFAAQCAHRAGTASVLPTMAGISVGQEQDDDILRDVDRRLRQRATVAPSRERPP